MDYLKNEGNEGVILREREREIDREREKKEESTRMKTQNEK